MVPPEGDVVVLHRSFWTLLCICTNPTNHEQIGQCILLQSLGSFVSRIPREGAF